jgi:hypothetical protein
MVNLGLKHLRQNSKWSYGQRCEPASWNTPGNSGRLRKLELKARLDGLIQNLTDAQLFSAFRDLVARGGGDDAFAIALHADWDENLSSDSVVGQRMASSFAIEFHGGLVNGGIEAFRP